MKYDVLVIGGGLGGLVSGAKLAKEGKKVMLIEQHDRAGGCATTFRRRNYTMEVGLHEMDGLHAGDMKNKIFDDLGISDMLTFLPVPEFFHFYNGRTDLVMPHTKEEAVAMLKEQFPTEHTGIDTYFERLMNYKRIHVKERDLPDKSVGEYLDEIFTDEEIKLVLLGNLGYFHDDPYTLSMRYFAVAESAYFHGRANYVQGGSQKLSNSLVKIIEANGGMVLLNYKVTSIIVEGSKVQAISYCRTGSDEANEKTIEADVFIANAALPEIAQLMGHSGKKLEEESAKHKIGASLLTVYFGFSKSLKELGNQHYSTFVYDKSVKTQKDILKNNHADFNERSFTFVDYSQIDSKLAPEGKSVGAVCCLDYLEDWEGLNRNEYNVKKAEICKIFADRVNQIVPGSKEFIEHIEVGTAKTVERYTCNPEGAVYGYAQHPNRQAIQSIPGIENMPIASAWGKFGGGFSGAIFSGYMTAMEILRKR